MPNSQCRDLDVLGVDSSRGPGFLELRLEPLDGDWTPGQFVMLRPQAWGLDPVWPRPFSICDQDREALRLFVQIVGRGTSRLAGLKAGDRVTVWGPLGQGFRLEGSARTLLLAGGVGLAPFVGLARRHPHPERLELLFGHRLPLDHYPFDEVRGRIAAQAMRQETDADIQAFVRVLEERIAGYAGDGLVQACGPTPFLRAVQRIALDTGARTQISLENRMACGVGACLGCVAETPDNGRVQTCTRGPVFWADAVRLT